MSCFIKKLLYLTLIATVVKLGSLHANLTPPKVESFIAVQFNRLDGNQMKLMKLHYNQRK